MKSLKDKQKQHFENYNKDDIFLYDNVKEHINDFEELCYYIQLDTYGELDYNLQTRYKNLLHKYQISSTYLPNEIKLHKIIFGDWKK